ncbi:MAG: hypothetical protein ACXWVO_08495 [Caulobacteraceae bacterium]
MFGVITAAVSAAPAAAAIADVAITGGVTTYGLTLENTSGRPSVEGRRIAVVGTLPTMTMYGRLSCASGWRAASAEGRFGNAAVSAGTHLIAIADHGKASLNFGGNEQLRNFTLKVPLVVRREATNAAIDLMLAPASLFEKRMKQAVAGGHTTYASYLRQTEAFNIPVNVSLVGWCERNGSRYGSAVQRSTVITVIYEGDPNIVGRAPVPPPPRAKVPPPRAKVLPPRAVTRPPN